MAKGLFLIIVFAIAFAFVEAAAVVYLRHLLGAAQPGISKKEVLFLVPGIAFLQPEAAVKIIKNASILNVERIREGATLAMLVAAGWLAGKKSREIFAYFLLAFGIWDIFYYVFLRLTIGWPTRLGDLDIFFLLPTPWAGPVFVPILISLFFVAGSLLYISKTRDG